MCLHFSNFSKATRRIASAVASGPPVVTTGRMSTGETGTVWPEPAICTPKNSPRSPSGGEAQDQSFVTLRHPSPTLQTQVGKNILSTTFSPRFFSYISGLYSTHNVYRKEWLLQTSREEKLLFYPKNMNGVVEGYWSYILKIAKGKEKGTH